MTLPQQPIPELEQTCRNLLYWIKPLVDSETFAQTSNVVNAFQNKTGAGPKLQNLLVNWGRNTKAENYAAPLWRELYLSSRHPLIIEGNVFFALESPYDSDLKKHPTRTRWRAD
ncbi:choline/carnitine O-acyltransferase [Desulforhopalus sp. 52FAK]